MKKNNVVSFFDGMGCLYIALKQLGIPIESYHAYEIDKHAMKAAKALNPNVIHKGDVRFFDIKDYPNGIYIFAGGSPCTDLSFAGKMSGLICNSLSQYMELRNEYLETKDENLFFHNGKFQQSILFWEWLRALKEIQKVNPQVYFLLENVIMPKVHEYTISKELGISPIRINANLVSAQNRDRLFWSNIGLEPFGLFGDLQCTIPQPKDRGILLKHILESDVKEKYYLSDKMLKGFFKHTQKHKELGNGFAFKPKTGENKGNCLTSRCHKMGVDDNYIKEFTVCVASRGRNPENPKSRESGLETEQMLEPRFDGKTNCLTSVQKDNLVLQLSEATKKGFTEIKPGECFDFENPNSKTRRGRKMEDKSNCLMAQQNQFMQFTEDFRIRRLTPVECERLQSLPDNSTQKGLELYIQLFNFTGNKEKVCNQYVEKKIVNNQFQIGKLNCATNTILDLSEMEQPKLDQQLTSLKNAKWTVATEGKYHLPKRVLCTIKDGKDTELLKYQKKLIGTKLNVSSVIQMSESKGLWECVLNITKCSSCTETHYTSKKEEVNLVTTDIIEIPMEFSFTEEWLKKLLEENLSKVSKLYTTLILTKLIITLQTLKSLRNQNTSVNIVSSIVFQENLSLLELLYIKMENTVLISDSIRYRMLGNGWNINVITHILSFINKSKP